MIALLSFRDIDSAEDVKVPYPFTYVNIHCEAIVDQDVDL